MSRKKLQICNCSSCNVKCKVTRLSLCSSSPRSETEEAIVDAAERVLCHSYCRVQKNITDFYFFGEKFLGFVQMCYIYAYIEYIGWVA